MLNWLILSFIALYVAVVFTVAADDDEHMVCTKESSDNHHQPGICDCTKATTECFIKFTITRSGNEGNYKYHINNERIGPTIIVNYKTMVVVDVYNLNPDAVSIHWHGMHQHRAQFMDGVGNITQVAIKHRETFRYIFSASPTGTHWYHSHMGDQRDKGILGALIVLEEKLPEEFPKVLDSPKEHVIAIQDNLTKLNIAKPGCEPDGSVTPESDFEIIRWVINGKELPTKIAEPNTELEPLFQVKPGQQYRFRIIGAMKAIVLRMSIDKHELDVISSDGYLTKNYSTDLLIIHVGERYDVIPRGKTKPLDGQVFLIRIESVAVHCNDFSVPVAAGYAYLKYSKNLNNNNAENIKVIRNDNRCRDGNHCVALNCPFYEYPNEHHRTDISCFSVNELELLKPTSAIDLPKIENVEEYFFNFDFPHHVHHTKAMVNGVQFVLPSKFPFVNPERKTPNEKCHYKCIDREFTDLQIYLCKTCSHTVRVPPKEIDSTSGEFKPKTIRFVFSSLPSKDETEDVTDVITHPIHLHGHSFFVREIRYPTYYKKNQTIKNVNQDLERSNCGPLSWKNEKVFPRLSNTTMRKDVIIVPAGGYVVVEFLADNPGWWFLHCHIDFHLEHGMAIAVNELPECQNYPPSHEKEFNPDESYDSAVETFKEYQSRDKCNIKPTPTTMHTPTQPKADNLAREANFHNVRQKYFNHVVNMNHDDQFASPYYKRLLHQRFRAHAADPEQRRFQDIRQRSEHVPEWNK